MNEKDWSEFMYKQSVKDFETLKQNLGNKVIVSYLRDGELLNGKGTLKGVSDFNGIYFSSGYIPFVGKEKIILTIKTLNDEPIYDRSYLINLNTRITKNLEGYKRYYLGSSSGKSPEFVESLRQDL